MTFVSLTTGWVLGAAPCGAGQCTQLFKTTDGGRTWVEVPAPPTPVSVGAEAGVREVRFANVDDGWVFLPDLWATHDGGANWSRQSIGQVFALEAASGAVHATVFADDGSGFTVATSPVHGDAWQPSATRVEAGAGPIPTAQLVLHRSTGWLIVVNRTVIGGARLESGRWVRWQPPCVDAGGAVSLAASSDSDLVAFCNEGEWNDRPQAERAYVSTDGGSSFQGVPRPLPIREANAAAAARPSIWVVGGADSNAKAVLLRTSDAGRTWSTVHREDEGGWLDLGFTSPQQGVAIHEGKAGKLLMTFDGGETWRAVGTS